MRHILSLWKKRTKITNLALEFYSKKVYDDCVKLSQLNYCLPSSIYKSLLFQNLGGIKNGSKSSN